MDKLEFADKLSSVDDLIIRNHIVKVLRKSIESNKDNYPRGHRNLIITMEELSELQKEISKELRGKGDYLNILQELADVYICMGYIQEICGISDSELNKAINVKINRLESVLNEKSEYQ